VQELQLVVLQVVQQAGLVDQKLVNGLVVNLAKKENINLKLFLVI
jgi:hypothetical protein